MKPCARCGILLFPKTIGQAALPPLASIVHRLLSLWTMAVGLFAATPCAVAAETPCWPGYVKSSAFEEQVREIRFASSVRVVVNAPNLEKFNPELPTLLVVYATPNGNTIEQTLGCELVEGLDWHFDIQHVAAQVRTLRAVDQRQNIVLAVVEAEKLSWPAWRAQHDASDATIRQIVESLATTIPGNPVRVVLLGHSGGGSFLFGYLNSVEAIPNYVERIAFLDANYSYRDELRHGEKFLQWIEADEPRHLVVIAYDDREIELDGKKVVGPTGGTYRASMRMVDYLKTQTTVEESEECEFKVFSAHDHRLTIFLHPNPENKILHTRLVGEMNGVLQSLVVGTPASTGWGEFGGPRAYTRWVQPAPYEPAEWHSPAPAVGKPRATFDVSRDLPSEASLPEREAMVLKAALSGQIPDFLRNFVEVRSTFVGSDGKLHEAVFRVAPDYLSIGTDEHFARMPLTPQVAQHLADVWGCVLPTRKMVDLIYQQADVKLEPQPMTEDRESLATFLEHHRLIQQQWKNRLPSQLVAGIKKDVVVTNRLAEKPGRVAIYGWHRSSGEPIQPLTTVHVESYVDYSHGIRLVDQWVLVDGKRRRVTDILQDAELCHLLSDEGPITEPRYRQYQNQ